MKFDPNLEWSGMVLISTITPNADQPRKYFDQAGLLSLGESLRARQEVPVTVIPFRLDSNPLIQWMLVDGERRWRAATACGLKKLWVSYSPGVDRANLHASSFRSNWHRCGHTKQETALAIAHERDNGLSYEQIGAMSGKSDAWAIIYHSLLQLEPSLLELMDPPTPEKDRLALKVGVELAKHPHERQLKLWRKLRHLPVSQQFHGVRQSAVVSAGHAPANDSRYVCGHVAKALQALKVLDDLGEVIIRRVIPEKRAVVNDGCRMIIEKARTLMERLGKEEA